MPNSFLCALAGITPLKEVVFTSPNATSVGLKDTVQTQWGDSRVAHLWTLSLGSLSPDRAQSVYRLRQTGLWMLHFDVSLTFSTFDGEWILPGLLLTCLRIPATCLRTRLLKWIFVLSWFLWIMFRPTWNLSLEKSTGYLAHFWVYLCIVLYVCLFMCNIIIFINFSNIIE